ncbi:hypothetical protein INS49_000213 [Diaporthe citri]|uniref:uncharacterized protein n=1 Tax=Diaporthe citri TaxID=83186 RepID=UPI001C81DB12|nr:uncharacterized protein INS49_000213 [Diaporthe citri]KAG6366037.1 hypothetical protein INS49_000213 [Diaporthe citri]
MASDSHSNRPEEAKKGIDQALLDYFATEEPGSTTETVSGDDVSAILADIEDIIDCLLSLAPSIHNGTEPKLTPNTSQTSTESNSQLERDTQLVRASSPTIDSMIAERLLIALSWRRTLIANWRDPSLKTNDPEKSKRI